MGKGVGKKSERSKKPGFGKRGQVEEVKAKPSLLKRLGEAVTRQWWGTKGSNKEKDPRATGFKQSRLER
jgi:hypothetical protein